MIKYSNIGTQIDIIITQTKEWINVSIADEGYGIKKQDIAKIFEYGTRLDNVGNEKGNGIGGYKLINELDKLGGQLHVKSNQGVGTEIFFKIPTI